MTTRRTGTFSLLPWLLTALALLGASSGCYSLVRHPGIATQNYERPPRETPCTSCHTPEECLAFVSSQRLERPRGPWGTLGDPWWFHTTSDSTRSKDAPAH